MGIINHSAKKSLTDSPGPGTYQIKKGVEGPAFSLGIKTESTMSKSISHLPAPGTYNPNSSFVLHKDGTTKFSTGVRRPMVDERKHAAVPGPMEYQPKDDYSSRSPPKYSFHGGGVQRPMTSPGTQFVPGPGHYPTYHLMGRAAKGGAIG